MKMKYNEQKAVWEFVHGNKKIELTCKEIGFIHHQMERNAWSEGIEYEINESEDNLIFDETTRDKFIGLCLDELESKWENMTLDNEPDYEGIVFDVANENGIWRY